MSKLALSEYVEQMYGVEKFFEAVSVSGGGESAVMDEHIARLRTHRKNIDRYQSLLQTKLSEAELQYLQKRLSEERFAMAMLESRQPAARYLVQHEKAGTSGQDRLAAP